MKMKELRVLDPKLISDRRALRSYMNGRLYVTVNVLKKHLWPGVTLQSFHKTDIVGVCRYNVLNSGFPGYTFLFGSKSVGLKYIANSNANEILMEIKCKIFPVAYLFVLMQYGLSGSV